MRVLEKMEHGPLMHILGLTNECNARAELLQKLHNYNGDIGRSSSFFARLEEERLSIAAELKEFWEPYNKKHATEIVDDKVLRVNWETGEIIIADYSDTQFSFGYGSPTS